MAEKSLCRREVGRRSPGGGSLAAWARGRASLRERRRPIRSRSRGSATAPPTGTPLATRVPGTALTKLLGLSRPHLHWPDSRDPRLGLPDHRPALPAPPAAALSGARV